MSRRLVALIMILILIVWMASWAFEAWRFRSALQQANAAIAKGRFDEARPLFVRLNQDRPNRSDVAYALGLCEWSLGHIDEALAAWGRVPPNTPEAARASFRRGMLARETGRFAIAEEGFREALKEPGRHQDQALQELDYVLRYQGRLDEVRQLWREALHEASNPVDVLRTLWFLDTEPFPIEGVSDVLEKAARQAPQDDRVWLGQANLAIRRGNQEEADRLLTRCQRKRPDDLAIWRTRMACSRAADDVPGVYQALKHLPADQFAPVDVGRLRAWFAARRGDLEAERDALREVLALAPGDTQVIERLADLAVQQGHDEEAAALRRRKSEMDQARERYRQILLGLNPESHAAELARVSETLGREFEAQGLGETLGPSGSRKQGSPSPSGSTTGDGAAQTRPRTRPWPT